MRHSEAALTGGLRSRISAFASLRLRFQKLRLAARISRGLCLILRRALRGRQSNSLPPLQPFDPIIVAISQVFSTQEIGRLLDFALCDAHRHPLTARHGPRRTHGHRGLNYYVAVTLIKRSKISTTSYGEPSHRHASVTDIGRSSAEGSMGAQDEIPSYCNSACCVRCHKSGVCAENKCG